MNLLLCALLGLSLLAVIVLSDSLSHKASLAKREFAEAKKQIDKEIAAEKTQETRSSHAAEARAAAAAAAGCMRHRMTER